MKIISTREAAKRLGIHFTTLAHHIINGKLPAPKIIQIGSNSVHAWTEDEVETARKLLPKIANGRKTRYQKKQSVIGNQQLVKPKRRPKGPKPRAKSRKQ